MTASGRVVGVDLGERRVGIAVSDSQRTQAFARSILVRSGNVARDREELARVVDELDAALVVLGLPLGLNGAIGPAAKSVLEEQDELRKVLSVPVETFDERLTTVEVSRRRRLMNQQERRGRAKTRVDDLAAEVMLQAFLDHEHHAS